MVLVQLIPFISPEQSINTTDTTYVEQLYKNIIVNNSLLNQPKRIMLKKKKKGESK